MKKALFLRFEGLYLTTVSLEKVIIVLEKKSRKSVEFWIQKSVPTL